MIKEGIGRKIKELREIMGLTQEQVAQKVGVSKEYISMLENGLRVPSLEVLYNLAQLFHQDVSYFLSEKESTFSVLFRSKEINKYGKEELLKFKKFCDDYIFLEEITKKEIPLAPKYSFKNLSNFKSILNSAEQMAEEERNRLGIGKEPIKDIFSLMENQGCHVVVQPLDNRSKIDGVFVFEGDRAFVLINGSQNYERQVFTAAHEYCHYLKDRDYKFWIDTSKQLSERIDNDKNPLETFANIFAGNFLMPKSKIEELIEKDLGERLGPEDIIYLKRYFGVSYQAILYRLKDLNYLSKTELNEYLQISPGVLESFFYKDSEKERDREQSLIPERFLNLALEAYLSKKISLGRLAELLEVDIISLKNVLLEAKILRDNKTHKGEKAPVEEDSN
ncbi:XRE family transcriptional regulator [Candidatus Aminicenantes bacterium AC-708-M15]|jgi:Zn-dependent peptidase ImmA (M78 family)|nr:XRE family transcriptional regulator [SCandidatus Aminicenantes bacterium Aminicenantia_JdfR_composite]MCP2596827.1 XRE family transcriptional regulator [Candidatus Aminicenantes bacterium AC-335-G13]MCP2604028.1 XRE family transcriptional regulator [Candidatus Aminicenantes bacterium AC-708-M15]MCP2620922.1 XRE family transcriptional regulator [Candidatus Aminicenantes bacterium AC-334-E05]